MLRDMASGMVSSGLRDAGYEHIWIDDGWALPRDNITHKPGGESIPQRTHTFHFPAGVLIA